LLIRALAARWSVASTVGFLSLMWIDNAIVQELMHGGIGDHPPCFAPIPLCCDDTELCGAGGRFLAA
jgi:hypothetical protein